MSLFVFGGILILSFVLLLRWSTAPGFRFSPVLLFYVIFALQQAVGSMFLLKAGDRLDDLAKLGLEIGAIGFTIGVGIVSVWARFRPSLELPLIRDRIRFDEAGLGTKVVVMFAGYLLSTAIVLYYFHQGGGMPLLQGVSAMLAGDETDVAQQIVKSRRMELTYAQVATYRGQGYVDQLRQVVLPYVFLCFTIWGMASKRLVLKLLGLLSGLPVMLFLMATGQRHPMLALLLSTTVLGYVLSNPRTHRKVLTIFFVVGLVVFIGLSFLQGRYGHTGAFGSDMRSLAISVAMRIFYSNAVGTIAVFHLFPNPEPFRWGTTWLNDLQGFLPGPYVAFSAWLYRRLYGVVGTASPMCFGEMFANFGMAGVFFGSAMLGMVLQGLQVCWARRKVYHAEHFVIYAVGSMAFARWAMGGLLTPIQYGLGGLPVLYVMIRAGQYFLEGASQSIRDAATRRSDGNQIFAARARS